VARFNSSGANALTTIELVGKIQERYGIAKDEAEKQVDSWIRNR
jgi:uncharacterized protein YjbJ (UPF0337 family)